MTARRASRLGIVVLGVLALGLLVAVGFGVRAFAARARDQAAFAAIDAQRPTELYAVRAAEEARLNGGPVPIEEAIRRLGARGRLGLGPELAPQQSSDPAPLMGWSGQMHDVPDWMMATPADAGGAPKP